MGILSFSIFASILFVSSIINPFSIFKSYNNSKPLYSVASISISFISFMSLIFLSYLSFFLLFFLILLLLQYDPIFSKICLFSILSLSFSYNFSNSLIFSIFNFLNSFIAMSFFISNFTLVFDFSISFGIVFKFVRQSLNFLNSFSFHFNCHYEVNLV